MKSHYDVATQVHIFGVRMYTVGMVLVLVRDTMVKQLAIGGCTRTTASGCSMLSYQSDKRVLG